MPVSRNMANPVRCTIVTCFFLRVLHVWVMRKYRLLYAMNSQRQLGELNPGRLDPLPQQ